jgi:RHS repeat-associated protein
VLAVNTFGALGLTARYSGTAEEYYIFDTQGSVAERINSSGGIDTNIETDAFGAVASSASFTDPFGYEAQAGYYTDQSTGLILTTLRYYDPGNGRFLNRDPIGASGGINVYGYCGNNATSETDPLGLWGFGGFGFAGAGGATLATGTLMEAAGVGADASVVGVPVGVVLNVAGAVVDAVGIVMIGAQIVSHWVSNATQGPVTRTPTSIFAASGAATTTISLIAGDGKELRRQITKLRPKWSAEKLHRVADGIEKAKKAYGVGGAGNVSIDKKGFITGPGPGCEPLGNVDDY